MRLQKLALNSSSIRFLAIIKAFNFFSSITGRNSSFFYSLLQQLEITNLLTISFFDWKPQDFTFFNTIGKEKRIFFMKFLSFSDSVWQFLLVFILSPTFRANFDPRNLFSPFTVQQIVFYNLSEFSYGSQKRLLLVNFSKVFSRFDLNFLLSAIFLPKRFKICLFRFFCSGLTPSFSPDNIDLFENLLANILLLNIEKVHSSVRFNSQLLIFLKPIDNELKICIDISRFLSFRGLLQENVLFQVLSSKLGFDFLGWSFKVLKNNRLCCVPSFFSCYFFYSRTFNVSKISNSKGLKSIYKYYSIIKKWKNYNKFCRLWEQSNFFSQLYLLGHIFNLMKVQNDPVFQENFFFVNSEHFAFFYSDLKFFCIHCGLFFINRAR